MRQIILETENIVVVSQEFPTEVVIVSFNEMGMSASGDRFWGCEYFEKMQISSIGIVSKTPNWYPEKDMCLAVAAINALTAGKTIVTYGHSQGGYGALKYSSRINASMALASCPQISINPADTASFDTRYTQYFKKDLRNGLKISADDLRGQCFIIYDPHFKEDVRHVEEISKLSNAVIPVVIPFSDHTSIAVFAEGGCARDVFSMIMAGKAINKQQLRNIIRSGRARSYSYFLFAANYLLKRCNRSTTYLTRYVARLSSSQQQLMNLRIAAAQGKFDYARQLLTEIEDGVFSSLSFDELFRLRLFFNRKGFIDGEVHVSTFLDSPKNDPFSRLHAIETFIAADMHARAISALEDIVMIDGLYARPSLVLTVHSLAKKLSRVDIFDTAFTKLLETPSTNPERLQICIAIVERLIGEGLHEQALRHLRVLIPLCDGLPDQKRRLANSLLAIGKTDMALAVRRSVLDLLPNDPIARLEEIEACSMIDRDLARKKLNTLMADSRIFWEKCSAVAERLSDRDLAIKATSMALALGAHKALCHNRLGALHLFNGDKQQCIKELRNITEIDNVELWILRSAANSALQAGDPKLAFDFASRQYYQEPSDIFGAFCFAKIAFGTGRREVSKEILHEIFNRAENGAPISAENWTAITDLCKTVGGLSMEHQSLTIKTKQQQEGNKTPERIS